MSKCIVCNTSEAIVHSGTDAFLLEVTKMIERICYPCANKHRQEKKENYDKAMAWYKEVSK